MKKKLLVALSLLLAFSLVLAACGDKTAKPSPSPSPSQTPSSPLAVALR